MKQIKSRNEFAASDLTDKQINTLLASHIDIVKSITSFFMRGKVLYDKSTVFAYALEGVYRAILRYDPKKGPLKTYAFFYCKSFVRNHIKDKDKGILCEIRDDDEDEAFAFRDLPMDDFILIDELKSRLTEQEKEIMDCVSYDIPIKRAMEITGIKTRYEYKCLLDQALAKARGIL